MIPANDAMKSIHDGLVRPRTLPAMTPAAISMIATESASSTLTIDASRTSDAMIVATSSGSMDIPPPVS